MLSRLSLLFQRTSRPLLSKKQDIVLSSSPARIILGCCAIAPPTALPIQEQVHQQQQVRYRSNRSRRGLYDGKDIRTGNNVSFSMKATKRKFRPNVFTKRVYSEILDDMIRFHLTASTLRSIDKAGGLDNYLLNNKNITEGEGYVIKRKILKRLKNQERYDRKAAEREQVEVS